MISNCLKTSRKTVQQQIDLIREFWFDSRFCIPILVIWVASFGGALHAPVTTYFYLQIGATELDLGTIGIIRGLIPLLLNPFYGWMQDKQGPFLAMCLSTFCCGFGCLIRGFAMNPSQLFVGAIFLGLGAGSLWTVVMTYIAAHTHPSRRSSILSAYIMQATFIQIFGKSLYLPMDLFLRHSLGIDDLLTRYRWEMGVCTLFCLFGLVALLTVGKHIRLIRPTSFETTTILSSISSASSSPPSSSSPSSSSPSSSSPSSSSPSSPLATASIELQAIKLEGSCTEVNNSKMETINNSPVSVPKSLHSDSVAQLQTVEENAEIREVRVVVGTPLSSSRSSSPSPRSSLSFKGIDGCRAIPIPFIQLMFVTLLMATSLRTCDTLWPLYVKRNFGWTSVEFGTVLFCSSIISASAVAFVAKMEYQLGKVKGPAVVCALAGICCYLAFVSTQPLSPTQPYQPELHNDLAPRNTQGSVAGTTIGGEGGGTASSILISDTSELFHAITSVLYFACLETISVWCYSLASVFLPPALQGRAMGITASVVGAGNILASYASTRLWKYSIQDHHVGGGTLPFLCVAFIMTIAALVLFIIDRRYNRQSKETAREKQVGQEEYRREDGEGRGRDEGGGETGDERKEGLVDDDHHLNKEQDLNQTIRRSIKRTTSLHNNGLQNLL